MALGTYHWELVDVVLSGLNLGLNLGNSIWHSGTLAAAKQAALLGVRGVALSAPAGIEPDFDYLKPWIRRVLDVLLTHPTLLLVNVNFPREPRGLVWTRASVRHYDGQIVPTKDPLGRELFWFTVSPIDGAEEGTDRGPAQGDAVVEGESPSRRSDGGGGFAIEVIRAGGRIRPRRRGQRVDSGQPRCLRPWNLNHFSPCAFTVSSIHV